MRVHLIDGTYELFRSFYGAPPALSPAGVEVGATRGLLRGLLSLLERHQVTHVAAAFDTVIESFRNDLFPGYKTSEGVEPALLAQFVLAERAAAALGIVVWPMVQFETDDALATAAARFGEDGRVEQVLLCSPDKDFAQCVRGSRVVMWDRQRDTLYDETGVRAKWGIEPASIPDWLALVGDDADGIPGVPRWGARSASMVLARWRHVEAVPPNAAAWDVPVRGAAALAESLEAHRKEVALYKVLATLRRDVPLAESLDDLMWRGADRRLMGALCDEIGDRELVGRISRWR